MASMTCAGAPAMPRKSWVAPAEAPPPSGPAPKPKAKPAKPKPRDPFRANARKKPPRWIAARPDWLKG